MKRNPFNARTKTKGWLSFYESEEISCLLPGKKDCVTIRFPDKTKIKKQKRLLLSNISEIYAQFKKENPDRKIGFSTFVLLRPKWCIPVGVAGTHNVFTYTYQQNVKLMLVAMNSSSNRQITKLCVCDVEKYDCMMGHCDASQKRRTQTNLWKNDIFSKIGIS